MEASNQSQQEAEVKINRYLSFLSQDPSNPKLLADLIELYLSSGQKERAQSEAVKALQLNPADERLQYLKVTCDIACQHFESAKQWLESNYQLNANGIWVVYNYAYVLFKLALYPQAVTLLEENKHRVNEYPALLLLQSRCLHFLGDYQAAYQSLLNMKALEPSHVEMQGLMALLLLDMGEFDKAERAAKAILASVPNQFEAMLALASVLVARINIKSAEAYFDKLMKVAATSGRVLAGKGQVEWLKHNFHQALSYFNEAVVYMPEHIGTWHNIAWCHLILNDLEEAQKAFQKAYDLDRNFADSHGGLGLCAAMKDEFDVAQGYVTRSLKLNKLNFTGRFAQSVLLRRQGNADEGDKLVKAILESASPINGVPMTDIISRYVKDKGLF